LIQASVLALLSAALPLAVTMSCTLLALNDSGIIENPTVSEIQGASSIHVLGFTSHDDLLVAESEGNFTLEGWNRVCDRAEEICSGAVDKDAMHDEGVDEHSGGLNHFLKSTLQEKVTADLHWRG
jgi:exosome complex component RRP46